MLDLKLTSAIVVAFLFLPGASAPSSHAHQLPLAPGVEKVCTIDFDKNEKYPARVEDSALPCLEQATNLLKQNAKIKLVLVGISHPVYDHLEKENGMERDVEDTTGADIRFSDVAAYRAINTKAYLTHWLGADPTKVIPTTDIDTSGRKVTIYTVPGDASYWHNYTQTLPINESVCTIKPCPDPIQERLTPQPRGKIDPTGAGSAHH